MAQRLEDSFEEFNIEHSLRSDNRFVDTLATLGSKIRLEGATTDITIVKRPILVVQMPKEDQLYKKLPGGVLAKRLSPGEFTKRLKEVHEKSCGAGGSMESCAAFTTSDWHIPFLEYLIEGILLDNHEEADRLKKLDTRYFVERGILFRKGFNGEPLICLGTPESQLVMQEVHAGERGDHPGKK
ncbi:uncharacterized protein LOC142635230 [Castanea sativa]|uniref:uncharacterized protein LOC142635230 n=1 Tax=Castanea sativa TaxID=21020 RepID=UPI003F65412D